jgi:hypothetical protein
MRITWAHNAQVAFSEEEVLELLRAAAEKSFGHKLTAHSLYMDDEGTCVIMVTTEEKMECSKL